jgi:hypothetical protein
MTTGMATANTLALLDPTRVLTKFMNLHVSFHPIWQRGRDTGLTARTPSRWSRISAAPLSSF